MAEKSRDSSPESKHHDGGTNQKDATATGANSDTPQSKLSDCSQSLQPEPINPSSEIAVASEQSEENAITTGSSTAFESQHESVSTGQTSGEKEMKHPPRDLLDNYKSYSEICLPLHIAALNGDVNDVAIDFLNDDPSVLGNAITKRLQTVFHVATGAKQIKFVKEMVNLLENKPPLEQQHILELQDIKGNNAFCYAAAAGTKPIAVSFLNKNKNLLEIRGFKDYTPLNIAALFGQRDMAVFLKEEIDQLKQDEGRDILGQEDRKTIFFLSIHNGWYDLASELLHVDDSLAVARDENDMTALHLLAKIPSAFTSESTGRRILGKLKNLLIPAGMNFNTHKSNSSTQAACQLLKDLWKEILCREYPEVEEFISKPTNLLFDAARVGNFGFLAELIRSYPCLVYELDNEGRSIFHIAIMHRHTATFNLIYDLGIDKQVIAVFLDKKGYNLLHLAAMYLSEGRAPSVVPGAALEMQQELILFKEVELLVMPTYREMKNSDGEPKVTPRELFTKEHANLLESAEKWMKQAANSCSVVATLIATGVFAAAFDLPGGDGNTNGTSVNPTKMAAFQIFSMADAVALASSSISILMFLSILTSRYAENDFLLSLPLKLVVGIATLFISIAAMMLAFSSSFFLTFGEHRFRGRFPVTISILASLSVIVFVMLQYGLFRDILYSSFRFRFSIKPGSSTSLWKKEGRRRFTACSSRRPSSDWGPPETNQA